MAGAAPIPFIGLGAQQRRIRVRLERAIATVLAHGQYIHGPEVAELEGRLAGFCGARRRGVRERDRCPTALAHGPRDRARPGGLRSLLHLCRDRGGRGPARGHALLRGRRRRRFPVRSRGACPGDRRSAPSGPGTAGGDPGGPIRPPGGLPRHRGRGHVPGALRHRRCRAGLRRGPRRPACRDARRVHRDELFPGQAARLLRGWRRHLHR